MSVRFLPVPCLGYLVLAPRAFSLWAEMVTEVQYQRNLHGGVLLGQPSPSYLYS